MSIDQILFDTVSNLTGGLIADLQTALVALIGIAFICMGFDLIRLKMENSFNKNNANTHFMEWKQAQDKGDTVRADIAKNKYRRSVRIASGGRC